MSPHEIEGLIATCVIALLALGTILPLGNALARRIAGPRRPAASLPNPADTERIERMERAIDAIAVEVERIAEGQRFVTKMLVPAQPADPGSGAKLLGPDSQS
jgi:hypothetical protein